jgi:tricorn protease
MSRQSCRVSCLRSNALSALAICVCALSLTSAADQAASPGQVLGARYPALSPDGQTLAFEYWGDIWAAPVDGSAMAYRLTDHVAWDYLPRFSPDGTQIAFNSRRSGNDDIWVMPSGGGVARQVTTHSGSDVLNAWVTDGSGIVFHSNRGLWNSDIYSVAIPREGRADEAVEQQLTASDHANNAYAQPLADGSYILQRGGGRWWRKRYHGSSGNQLWRLSKAADGSYGEVRQLTNYDGRNDWPMLGASGVAYYVCDEDGSDNIWALDMASGQRKQITHHATDGVQWPSIQPGGEMIAYDFGGGLWITSGNGHLEPRQIQLYIGGEGKDNLVQRVSFADNVGSIAVSPNGKYVVGEYMGDLWAVRDPETYGKDDRPDQDIARALRLTATDGVRERYPVFAPDNKWLAFNSDDGPNGQYTLHVLDISTNAVSNLGYGSGDNLQPEFDPTNSEYLFSYTGNTELRRFNLKDNSSVLVAKGNLRDAFGFSGYDVSPDGKWVAYVNSENDWSSEVYIVPADGSQPPVNITKDPGADNSPQWSRDGSRLVWRSDRDDETTAYYAVELNPAQLPVTTDFFLKEEPADKTPDKDKTEKDGDDSDDEADKSDDSEDGKDEDKSKDKKKPTKPVVVKINFEDIAYRARRLTRQEGIGTGVVSHDGKWLVYEANPDSLGNKVFSVRIDPRPQGAKSEGWEPTKQLDSGWSQPQVAADGKRIYYREAAAGGGRRGGGGGGAPTGGAVKYAKFDKGKLSGIEPIALHADYTFDQQQRWRQMFREGWHVLGERFYDPNMHGVDWAAMYAKYSPYMDHIRTPEEFEFVFSELLGELNASHLGITMASSSYSGGGPTTGHLGLEFNDGTMSLPWSDPVAKGMQRGPLDSAPTNPNQNGLAVKHITYRGPADQEGVDIKPFDIVLSIDGKAVSRDSRWYDLLQDKAGQPVKLRVSRAGKQHDVVIKATDWGGYQGLLYREWEKLNEDAVAQASGGKLGYIHIAGMSGSELAKFKREFLSETFDKAGLIVDVRFNPGGFIHEDLFELLDRQAFGWNVPRDAPWTVQPSRAFLKPKALLINGRSGSDAEIFPSGWRTQQLGPVIGMPTAGAVIGTSGFTLVDGSWVRLPLEGWYELSGRNLETEGTPPDVQLDVDPNALRRGEDAQLAKAIELVMADVAKAPPLPTPPQAYPKAR